MTTPGQQSPDAQYPAPQAPAPQHPGYVNQIQNPGMTPEQQHEAAMRAAERKLPTFMKISIVLLAALSVASISMLFLGKFEGSFIRIFSTFVIFTIFVLLTALDTHLDQRSTWYAPVALIGNSYILAIVLIVTWMTDYEPFFMGWIIFWKALFVILATRLVVLCCQLLIGRDDRYPPVAGIFAMITSVLAVVSGILFTAPVAIDVFDVRIPDLYWRFAVAALLLTALGLAITLLLRWQYGAGDRERARAEREIALRAQQQHYASLFASGNSGQPVPMQNVPMQNAPMQTAPMAPQNIQGALPWPTFPDGNPLPMGPDGQPDFSVLNR